MTKQLIISLAVLWLAGCSLTEPPVEKVALQIEPPKQRAHLHQHAEYLASAFLNRC